jgi:hypothetical protein
VGAVRDGEGKRDAEFLGFLVVLGMVVASITSVRAAGETQHYTIANSGSTDSGTCGTIWAADTFDRDYTISAGQVVEDFKNGAFTTLDAPSPGACQTTPGPLGNGHVVTAGLTGNLQGEEVILVLGGTFNPDATCTPTTCQNIADVIATYFGAETPTLINSFDFHYSSGSTGEWKNASLNRGGNHGDIYTS